MSLVKFDSDSDAARSRDWQVAACMLPRCCFPIALVTDSDAESDAKRLGCPGWTDCHGVRQANELAGRIARAEGEGGCSGS